MERLTLKELFGTPVPIQPQTTLHVATNPTPRLSEQEAFANFVNATTIAEQVHTPFLESVHLFVNNPDIANVSSMLSLLVLATNTEPQGITQETRDLAIATVARLFSNGDSDLEHYYRQALTFAKQQNVYSILRYYILTYQDHPLAIKLREEIQANKGPRPLS